MAIEKPLKVHGLDLSYFTGKLEGYLRGKGIAYDLIEMDTRDFKRCAKATGVAQMPQVEWTNGTWLTDTTLIIEFLEQHNAESSVMPVDPMMKFMAQLIEDFGDEWLWRPALYYRWANTKDARLLSHRLAEGMMRDVPLPFFLRRLMIKTRQQFLFLWKDGYSKSTAPRIEAHYLETLDALEKILQQQPFVLGKRPTLADYGLYGAMFRHFFCDPTPAMIMRKRAPAVHEWVARVWNLKLSDYNSLAFADDLPVQTNDLMGIVTIEFIPYMQANEAAVLESKRNFKFNSQGTSFKIPAQRYRAWRYQRLRQRFQELDSMHQEKIKSRFPALCVALSHPVTHALKAHIDQLPVGAATSKVMGRAW